MMKKILFVVSCVLIVGNVCAQEGSYFERSWNDVKDDYIHFYDGQTLLMWGGGLIVGGILANTDADQEIHDWYQDDVRGDGTDDISDLVKNFGEGRIMVPLYLGAAVIGQIADDSPALRTAGRWGEQSMRSLVVGVPMLLAFQMITGGSRPTDDDGDSSWDPFNDGNGVSGHSFMGAVPFLTAARMTDRIGLKALFYGSSVLCGLSRVNDEDHYFSQSLLGWWLAYLSVDAVGDTEWRKGAVSAGPMIYKGNPAFALSMDF